jgi:hypothetical protein
VIGCAIEVHRKLWAGLLESAYVLGWLNELNRLNELNECNPALKG